MNRLLTIAVLVLASLPASVVAQPLPTPMVEEVMVKTSLLTFNDANVTGNYAVLHAKLAKPFRDRYSAEDLKQVFKGFAGKHIDVIAAKPIVRTSEARISNGRLMLRGYFDTAPNRLNYELDFVVSEGEWKLVSIDVKSRPAPTSKVPESSLLARAGTDFSGREE